MKKGFTLIELLAVIIILAIVALIATPIILDVVEDARKSAAKSEASMILSGIQSYCATEDMKIQMGSMEDTAAKCSGKSSIAASDVSAMANLGNASVSPQKNRLVIISLPFKCPTNSTTLRKIYNSFGRHPIRTNCVLYFNSAIPRL